MTQETPPSLASLVSHARRLSRALATLERERRGVYWLVGRSAEIDCFLEDLAADVGCRRLGAAGAAQALAEYLDVVHGGAKAHLRSTLLPCCTESTPVHLSIAAASPMR